VGLAAAAFAVGAAVVLGLVAAERRSRSLPDAG
jgi:hypothetical protein